jgi:hypothetical protein
MAEKHSLTEAHNRHIEDMTSMKNWRALYSWHGWGSPIGLSLGYGIFVVSTGICLWLLSLAGLVGRH